MVFFRDQIIFELSQNLQLRHGLLIILLVLSLYLLLVLLINTFSSIELASCLSDKTVFFFQELLHVHKHHFVLFKAIEIFGG